MIASGELSLEALRREPCARSCSRLLCALRTNGSPASRQSKQQHLSRPCRSKESFYRNMTYSVKLGCSGVVELGWGM